ncbi:unnamed protein product [Allacma fusca]|uniref:Uncharacterized protein n=1 Tax=Allacma fusca TaxID=39272 RepID=A0A8J2J857_9HEXA|nr:unnamed protein product [Allacma fusca]
MLHAKTQSPTPLHASGALSCHLFLGSIYILHVRNGFELRRRTVDPKRLHKVSIEPHSTTVVFKARDGPIPMRVMAHDMYKSPNGILPEHHDSGTREVWSKLTMRKLCEILILQYPASVHGQMAKRRGRMELRKSVDERRADLFTWKSFQEVHENLTPPGLKNQ